LHHSVHYAKLYVIGAKRDAGKEQSMGRWNQERTGNQESTAAERPGEQVWTLAALGALIGALLGWLTASGALPHPTFLPIPANAILTTTLVCAAIGAFISGILGLIADLSERAQATETLADEGHADR
jgi:hypothetical protein